MFAWLKSRNDLQQRAAALHGAIVAEARAPHLYTALGVPDSLDGRLEMLALHMVMALDRLGRAGPAGAEMARAVTEAYVIAMDDTMRAIGVGDLAVPRKVKKAAAMLYDRHRTYAPALAARDDAALWQAALAKTLSDLEQSATIDWPGLGHYVATRAASLAATADDVLVAGVLGG